MLPDRLFGSNIKFIVSPLKYKNKEKNKNKVFQHRTQKLF